MIRDCTHMFDVAVGPGNHEDARCLHCARTYRAIRAERESIMGQSKERLETRVKDRRGRRDRRDRRQR